MNYFVKKIILGCFCFLLFSCEKNKFNQQNTLVPFTRVNFTAYDANLVSIPGSFKIFNQGGYLGQIIVFNIDGKNFKAFDLACPYINPNECKTPMDVDSKTGEMSCKGCAQDDITFTQYGTGIKIGQSTYYLREYNAYLERGEIRVTNF